MVRVMRCVGVQNHVDCRGMGGGDIGDAELMVDVAGSKLRKCFCRTIYHMCL